MKRAVWDVVLTVILLVASFGVLLVSAFFDLFAIAFTDYCPEPCQAGTGIAALFTVWSCSAILALVGAIVSIVRLTRRRRAWWVALIALALVIIGGIGAFWIYASIVDH